MSPEEFRSLRLSFSPNLDDYNPDIPEWRRDISRVIKKSLVEVSADSSSSCPGPFLSVLAELPREGTLTQRGGRRGLEARGRVPAEPCPIAAYTSQDGERK